MRILNLELAPQLFLQLSVQEKGQRLVKEARQDLEFYKVHTALTGLDLGHERLGASQLLGYLPLRQLRVQPGLPQFYPETVLCSLVGILGEHLAPTLQPSDYLEVWSQLSYYPKIGLFPARHLYCCLADSTRMQTSAPNPAAKATLKLTPKPTAEARSTQSLLLAPHVAALTAISDDIFL